jgi:hypothetical protein
MVESVKVSPEMKEQKNFLFSISGGTWGKVRDSNIVLDVVVGW